MRKTGNKKPLCGVLLALALLLLGACARSEETGQGTERDTAKAEEPGTGENVIRIFDKNAVGKFEDEIAQEIMDRTGLSIEVIDATDSPGQKAEMMLVNGDYPDIILVDINDIDAYREAGCLVDLSGYVDREDSAVKSMYGSMLNRLREQDGSLYYLSNWYGRDEDAVSAFQIRYDYLVSLVGKERADSDEPFKEEEFLELLRLFRERYPEIGGESSIPFTVNLDLEYDNCFRGMYGMKLYYEEDGRLYHLARHPRYLDMLRFMNTMYREGLLNKTWVASHTSLFEENVESGRTFATACAYWDLGSVNRELQAAYGEDAVMLGYKVVGSGLGERDTTYGGRNTIGWDAIAVTDNCRDVDAAMRLIEFLASEEGQYLMLWGIEGKHWVWNNGVHEPTEETLELLRTGMLLEQTPIRKWTWFIKNGYGTDGTPYDLSQDYMPDRIAEVSNRNMKYDYWDMAPYSGLEPERGTQESLQWRNIQEIWDRAYPKMVNAVSEEALEEIYRQTLENMETAGLTEAEAAITEKYRERLRLWGEEENG